MLTDSLFNLPIMSTPEVARHYTKTRLVDRKRACIVEGSIDFNPGVLSYIFLENGLRFAMITVQNESIAIQISS
jgi:hypothetical protein